MTVSEFIEVLSTMPQQSHVTMILGCGRRYVAADLDSARVQLTHRERGSNVVTDDDDGDSEPVVGIVW